MTRGTELSGYEADIEKLRQSADAATSVDEQARRIGLGESMTTVATGLPGSESAAVAMRLAGAWEDRLGT
ncbi:MAG: hypothetical protein ACRDTC_25610 [Pseudonocardiaceae bacterium]